MEQSLVTFFVVRYFPNVFRDEAINIGIIVVPDESDKHPPVVRFTKDWQRVLSLDPGADVELLADVEGSLREQLIEAGPLVHEEINRMYESYSNSLRLERNVAPRVVKLGSGKGSLVDDFDADIEQLCSHYLG